MFRTGLVAEDFAAIIHIAGDFKALATQRLEHKPGTQKREEAESLLMGFPGDEVVEMGQYMFEMAQLLPAETWKEYEGRLDALSSRIAANLHGEAQDLPEKFLDLWKKFIERWGCRGTNEMSVSSGRYGDTTTLLLSQLQGFSGPGVKNPSQNQQAMIEKRKAIEATLEKGCCACGVRARSQRMEHLTGLRDNCKLRLVESYAAMQEAVLPEADKLVADGRLDSITLLSFDL